MAKSKITKNGNYRLILNEEEAALVAAVFSHVRLGSASWNSVAFDILEEASEAGDFFCEECFPAVGFTHEDVNGNEIGGIFTTIEVGDAE
jgi:hypothetical protein